MNSRYYVTGAAGHLGTAVVNQLADAGQRVRALLLPGDQGAARLPDGVEAFYGDVCDRASVGEFLAHSPKERAVVIHAAGIVSIASKIDDHLREVNIGGTRNLLEACKRQKVDRLVHVSSVHAILEKPAGETIAETDRFDPALVEGGYAKSKAEATALVLQSASEGLNASVVHPSGILGPYDWGRGHLTQLVIDYMKGRLTSCVRGGYDFVDVRDVAAGIISCCERGRQGECYILSNRYYEVTEILQMLHEITGHKAVRRVLPNWFVSLTAPLAELYYKLMRQPPLFTSYSIYTLRANALFSHEKADQELGYTTRPMRETLEDMVRWMKENGRL